MLFGISLGERDICTLKTHGSMGGRNRKCDLWTIPRSSSTTTTPSATTPRSRSRWIASWSGRRRSSSSSRNGKRSVKVPNQTLNQKYIKESVFKTSKMVQGQDFLDLYYNDIWKGSYNLLLTAYWNILVDANLWNSSQAQSACDSVSVQLRK